MHRREAGALSRYRPPGAAPVWVIVMIPPTSKDDPVSAGPAVHKPIFYRLRASIGQVLSDMAAYPPPPINPYMPTVGFPGVAQPFMGENHLL